MRYFLDRNVTVRRLRNQGTNLSAFSATGTAYTCSFQDPTPERTQLYNGQIGKTYEVFIPNASTNINEADQIVIGSSRYSVKAKEVVDFGGQQFITLIVVKNDA